MNAQSAKEWLARVSVVSATVTVLMILPPTGYRFKINARGHSSGPQLLVGVVP